MRGGECVVAACVSWWCTKWWLWLRISLVPGKVENRGRGGYLRQALSGRQVQVQGEAGRQRSQKSWGRGVLRVLRVSLFAGVLEAARVRARAGREKILAAPGPRQSGCLTHARSQPDRQRGRQVCVGRRATSLSPHPPPKPTPPSGVPSITGCPWRVRLAGPPLPPLLFPPSSGTDCSRLEAFSAESLQRTGAHR